jgi:ribose transport system substrate-binding protein
MLCVVGVMALVTSVCKAEQAQAPSSDQPKIYGLYVGLKGTFWAMVENGAEKAAAEAGYRLVYLGSSETDVLTQKELFQKALEAGAKGIFIAPNNTAIEADVAAARKRGIPVVYVDRKMGEPSIDSFIGTDNVAAGRAAGQELVKKMGAGKNIRVVVFRLSKDVISTTQREEGFIDTVTKAGYTVVASPYMASEVGDGRVKIEKFLNDPDAPLFDAVFTPNEKTTNAALLAMRGSSRRYVHIGFDSGQLIEKALKDGSLYATIIQQPFQMGYYAVKTLDKVLKKEKVEPFVESKFVFVTKDNIAALNQP